MQAIRESNLDELRKLLAGMSERERCWADAQGRTLLHHAVLEGHAECIAMLDVHTVRAHVADAFSMTPLMLAVARREDECASMLRAQRAPLISALNEVRPSATRAWPRDGRTCFVARARSPCEERFRGGLRRA